MGINEANTDTKMLIKMSNDQIDQAAMAIEKTINATAVSALCLTSHI